MNASSNIANKPLAPFFVLVFALAIPFWVIGGVTGVQLLPGLPIAALSAVCPALAAAILHYRQDGGAGATALLKRSFDFRRIQAKAWYLPALLFMPVTMALSFGVLRLLGKPIPVPQVDLLTVLILCVAFFVGALGEELGWSAYATDPMQARWGALWAGILLGAVSALYHYIPLAQAHRSFAWTAWWSLYTVAGRVILVWLYNNTGRSVFATVLFHMTINVTWQLFPVNGSYFDPGVTGSIMAVTAAIIVMLWGPRTLARFRYA